MGINGWSMLHFAAKVGVLKFYRFLVKEARLGANSHSLQGNRIAAPPSIATSVLHNLMTTSNPSLRCSIFHAGKTLILVSTEADVDEVDIIPVL
jgi:hypothetical protein